MRAITTFLLVALLLVTLMPLGYWHYTFQIVKPRCLAVVDEKTNSIKISSSSRTTTEAQFQKYVTALDKINGVTRTEVRTVDTSSEFTVWNVDAYHNPSISGQEILVQAQKLAKETGLTILISKTNVEDYGGFRTTIERITFNPAIMLGEVLYLPFIFTKNEPSLLAPPLRLFMLCSRGEI